MKKNMVDLGLFTVLLAVGVAGMYLKFRPESATAQATIGPIGWEKMEQIRGGGGENDNCIGETANNACLAKISTSTQIECDVWNEGEGETVPALHAPWKKYTNAPTHNALFHSTGTKSKVEQTVNCYYPSVQSNASLVKDHSICNSEGDNCERDVKIYTKEQKCRHYTVTWSDEPITTKDYTCVDP